MRQPNENLTENANNDDNDTDQRPITRESSLQRYRLARDRIRREVRPPERFGYTDLIAYAFNVAEELNEDEPKTFSKAVQTKDLEN